MGYVYTNRNGVMLRSPYEDSRFDRSLDQQRKSITRNMICVPLKTGTFCHGCLEISNKRSGPFTESDYQLVISVAKEIAAGFSAQSLKKAFSECGQEGDEFRTKVAQIAGENLLTPLLKSILIILADILKSEKYINTIITCRIMLYVKSIHEDTIVLSEVSSNGIVTSNTSQIPFEMDVKTGCAGLSFLSKEIVFEPFAQSSSNVSKQEMNPEFIGTIVHSIIAVPIFDESGNSVGVFEIINCEKQHFSSPTTKTLLSKFAKYISLLFYTNNLLKVKSTLYTPLEHSGELRDIVGVFGQR